MVSINAPVTGLGQQGAYRGKFFIPVDRIHDGVTIISKGYVL